MTGFRKSLTSLNFHRLFSLRMWVVALSLFMAVNSWAVPAQVVLIRHAEKPPTGNQVTPQGCERSFNLPQFFMSNPVVNAFGKPAAIYAQSPNKEDGTLRPVETIAPTSLALGLTIDDAYNHKQTAELANEILTSPAYEGKTILVAWEHDAIPQIVLALGLTSDQIPNKWPDKVFDQAWVITFASPPVAAQRNMQMAKSPQSQLSSAVNLNIIPEFVLPTDNPQGGDQWKLGPQPPTDSSPVVLPSVQQECVDNQALNKMVQMQVETPLPAAAFGP